MKIQIDEHELDICDKNLPEDDCSILNYCHSMAGHTIMINPEWELVPVKEINPDHLFLLQKKKKCKNCKKRK